MSDDVFETDAVMETATGEADASWDSDEPITEKKYKELVAGNLIPNGDYVLQITEIKAIPPDNEKPMGGFQYNFLIKTPPAGAIMPEDGWPVLTRLFKRFLNPDEKQKKSEGMDKTDEAKLWKACGVQAPFKPSEARAAIKGRVVIATAVQTESKGNLYQNLKAFKPVAG